MGRPLATVRCGSLAILALLRARPDNPYLWAAYAAQVTHERTR